MSPKSTHDQGIMRRLVTKTVKNHIEDNKRKRRREKLAKQGDERPQAALIFGAGVLPGIGAAVAMRAATGGLRTYVTGRTVAKLDATVAAIREAGGQAEAMVVDVRQPEQIKAAFQQVQADGCRLELVVHNVGTNRIVNFLDITPELLEKSWVADCRSGFLVGQQAIATMLEQTEQGQNNSRGTLLFTGASASLRGKAGFASFAQAKAGLRMLAQALAREYGPEGIHVAHIIIDGIVDGARLRGFVPEFVEAQGEDGALNPRAIAETYWNIYQQHRSIWTQEIDLRPFKENW